ncbi:hypothetical protein ZWY2020_003470 [Hordeum vulgare]|nr:hypothetical protein ZWY2020_003461 [Hordeum vulgare]KAI4972541.1 hypothetical protein ZWY2020_003466 [Hordeum vulgare]KAI4972545.1 hypothetical protein ZWY2020_003470 [Hordeum vulgare]
MASSSSANFSVRGRRCSFASTPSPAAVVVHGAVTIFLGRSNAPDAALLLPSTAASPVSSQLRHRCSGQYGEAPSTHRQREDQRPQRPTRRGAAPAQAPRGQRPLRRGVVRRP